jgi:hypothetical protein
MELDRQELPPSRRPQPPQRVPEANPPLLGDWFIYLSIVVLVCGVIAITVLAFGNEPNLRDPLVRIPVLIAAGLLVPIAADGGIRAWRSAWAWLPIDRPRGLSRFIWAAVLFAIMLGSVATVIAFLVL